MTPPHHTSRQESKQDQADDPDRQCNAANAERAEHQVVHQGTAGELQPRERMKRLQCRPPLVVRRVLDALGVQGQAHRQERHGARKGKECSQEPAQRTRGHRRLDLRAGREEIECTKRPGQNTAGEPGGSEGYP